jgi:hypothetical protein
MVHMVKMALTLAAGFTVAAALDSMAAEEVAAVFMLLVVLAVFLIQVKMVPLAQLVDMQRSGVTVVQVEEKVVHQMVHKVQVVAAQ